MKNVLVITDDVEPPVYEDKNVEVIYPRWSHYNGGEPTFAWKIFKFRNKEYMLNPWLYKLDITSRAYLGYEIHILTTGTLGRYAKYILDKNKRKYTTNSRDYQNKNQ
tara:strand:- start:416 stop:736 length:321 start_codon:yes stop_codon:yes gene_type:complete